MVSKSTGHNFESMKERLGTEMCVVKCLPTGFYPSGGSVEKYFTASSNALYHIEFLPLTNPTKTLRH